MYKHVSLIDECFIPLNLKDETTAKKYSYFSNLYNSGAKYILLNNIKVFGPFSKANLPWDISETQKIAIYNPEVTKVLNWIKTRIVINLSNMDYKTLDVLIRIATGMLNKCSIPKEVQILFHDNMVRNLQKEYYAIISSDLPF